MFLKSLLIQIQITRNLQSDKCHHLQVREWMDPTKSRPVKVNFGSDGQISLINRKSETLRTFNLVGVDKIALEVTRDTRGTK